MTLDEKDEHMAIALAKTVAAGQDPRTPVSATMVALAKAVLHFASKCRKPA